MRSAAGDVIPEDRKSDLGLLFMSSGSDGGYPVSARWKRCWLLQAILPQRHPGRERDSPSALIDISHESYSDYRGQAALGQGERGYPVQHLHHQDPAPIEPRADRNRRAPPPSCTLFGRLERSMRRMSLGQSGVSRDTIRRVDPNWISSRLSRWQERPSSGPPVPEKSRISVAGLVLEARTGILPDGLPPCIHPIRHAADPRWSLRASSASARDLCIRTPPRVLRAVGPRSRPASPPGGRGSP